MQKQNINGISNKAEEKKSIFLEPVEKENVISTNLEKKEENIFFFSKKYFFWRFIFSFPLKFIIFLLINRFDLSQLRHHYDRLKSIVPIFIIFFLIFDFVIYPFDFIYCFVYYLINKVKTFKNYVFWKFIYFIFIYYFLYYINVPVGKKKSSNLYLFHF